MTRRLTLLLLCLAGCQQPDIEFVEWDPLEVEEVETALGEPTALLDDALTAERLQAIGQRMLLLLEHTRFAAEVVDALGEAADLPPDAGTVASDAGGELASQKNQGTVYYLGLGCPGAGPEPHFSTENGVLRIDSERLDSLDPRPLLDGGSVLFRFEDCQVGQMHLSGRAPAALQIGREVVDPAGEFPLTERRFAMAADLSGLQAKGTESPLGVAGFLCRGFGRCAEHQDVRAEIVGDGAGTLVASFALDRNYWLRPQKLVLKLETARGSASCEYDIADRSLDCDRDGI